MLKLGFHVAETTVGKYMASRPGPPSQSWRTFVNNHRSAIVAIDFLTVPTAALRILYVFVVLSLDRRRIVHFSVTDSPTAEWTSLQLTQAFPFDTAPRYVIRDRDSIYGEKVVATLRALGIEDKVIFRADEPPEARSRRWSHQSSRRIHWPLMGRNCQTALVGLRFPAALPRAANASAYNCSMASAIRSSVK